MKPQNIHGTPGRKKAPPLNTPQPSYHNFIPSSFMSSGDATIATGTFSNNYYNNLYGISRSSSAPPIEKITSALPADLEKELGLDASWNIQQHEEEDSNNPSQTHIQTDNSSNNFEMFRRDPSYTTYFHWHSRLDPRLPAPEYRPGQSSFITMNTTSLTNTTSSSSASSTFNRKKFTEMIQEDFPKTPSPVYNDDDDADDVVNTLEEMNIKGNQISLQKIQIPTSKLKWNPGAAPYVPPSYTTTSVEDKMNVFLEDLRNGRTPLRYTLQDLSGVIGDISCDQHGSRYIQQRLECDPNSEEAELVFQAVLPVALHLMTDVFGNYVIQKFFEFGTERQKIELSRAMQGSIVSLSLQMYGCRVIQKALENLEGYLGEQAAMIAELKGQVLLLVKDQNGNHVIQKCIEKVPLDVSGFILKAFQGQIYDLAIHPYGCRVIQRILEHTNALDPTHKKSPANEALIRNLLEELAAHTKTLVLDQYGNYVLQHILEKDGEHDKNEIIKAIMSNFLEYSRHKFASNVVEKCICHGSYAQRQAIVTFVLTISREGDEVPLFTMMKDQYANYVVQKMLEIVESDLKEQLLVKLRPHYPMMKKYTYGKHILAKLEKMGESVGVIELPITNPPSPIKQPSQGIPVIKNDDDFPPLGKK
jgi:hypothetical protein